MRALHKSKSVSWPPDFELCQVRFFKSEDSPSQVGSELRDHLEAKSSGPSHPCDDDLPPGFGGLLFADESQIQLSDIPVIKWKSSVRILIDEEWRVVSGEESREVESQHQREHRVLEAFYPGASSIPPNPSDPSDADYDDQQTVVIPIQTVEDDDVATSLLPTQSGVDVSSESTSASSTTLPSESEIMAALSAMLNNKEQGISMIDKDLLIQFLSNRELLENLFANRGSEGSVSSNASSLFPSSSTHEANGVVTTTPACSNEQYYPQPVATHTPPPAPSDQSNYGAAPPPARDAIYYKSLIQQHGGERQEAEAPPVQRHLGYSRQPGGGPNGEMVNNNNNNQRRPRDSTPKMMKPCLYFNSPRGCRNGANCFFKHEATAYQPRNHNNGHINNNPEMHIAKRKRYDRN